MMIAAAVAPRAIPITCVRRARVRQSSIAGISASHLNRTGGPRVIVSCSFSSSLSRMSLVEKDVARAGTEAWVRDWVIGQGMCPFAPQSAYRIVPCCGQELDEILMGIQEEILSIVEEISILGDSKQRRPNTLVVVPNFDPFRDHVAFQRIYHLMCSDAAPEYLCGPYQMIYEGSLAPVVMQAFHPEFDNSMIENQPFDDMYGEDEDTSALKYSLRSPWPTLHLMRTQDLQEAQGEDDTVTWKILQKNAQTLSSIGATELQRKLESYRSVMPEDV